MNLHGDAALVAAYTSYCALNAAGYRLSAEDQTGQDRLNEQMVPHDAILLDAVPTTVAGVAAILRRITPALQAERWLDRAIAFQDDETLDERKGELGYPYEQLINCILGLSRILAVRPHDAVAAAWADFKDSYGQLVAEFGEAASEQFEHEQMVRADQADMAIAREPAQSAATIGVKLRRLFMQQVGEPWAQAFAFGEDTPETRDALDKADMWEQALWSAVEDVERLAERRA